jgi:hypothetical protein
MMNHLIGHNARAAVASWLAVSLLLMTSGCSLGMLFPASIDAELKEDTPLQRPAPDIHRIAVALPSLLEATLLLPDPSRGKLDRVALDVAERLEDSERFKIVPTDQFQTALAAQGPEPDSLRVSLTEPDPWTAILTAARQVGAEAILMFEGRWESPLSLGDITFGRPEFRRQVGMTLVDVRTGQTIWHQKATAVISEGIAVPQESAMRRAVASALTKNFLKTVK